MYDTAKTSCIQISLKKGPIFARGNDLSSLRLSNQSDFIAGSMTMRHCIRLGTAAALSSILGLACGVADARELDVPFRAIVPNSWTLLPRAPDSLGRRFTSPSGDAWLWYFAVPARAQGRSPTARGQATYEARGADWTVTSGYRGDRIFYRRAMLACHNTKWRQIEFEYPASEKRLFDNFVTRTSYALRAYKELGC
jgi:hypothetical protein